VVRLEKTSGALPDKIKAAGELAQQQAAALVHQALEARGEHDEVHTAHAWPRTKSNTPGALEEQHLALTEARKELDSLHVHFQAILSDLRTLSGHEPKAPLIQRLNETLAGLIKANTDRRLMCRLATSAPGATFAVAKTWVSGSADLAPDQYKSFLSHVKAHTAAAAQAAQERAGNANGSPGKRDRGRGSGGSRRGGGGGGGGGGRHKRNRSDVRN
jgi:hypothetical protein